MITEIHIVPNSGNGYLDTTLTAYRGRDAQGWVLPEIERKLSEFPRQLLPTIGAAVGVLQAVAESDGCRMERIILTRSADAVVMNDDGLVEISRTPVFVAVCDERRICDDRPRTITRTSSELPAQFRGGCLAALEWLEKQGQ